MSGGDYRITVKAKDGNQELGTAEARFLVPNQDLELDRPADRTEGEGNRRRHVVAGTRRDHRVEPQFPRGARAFGRLQDTRQTRPPVDVAHARQLAQESFSLDAMGLALKNLYQEILGIRYKQEPKENLRPVAPEFESAET